MDKYVNIQWGLWFVPSGNKPLHETMLGKIYDAT